jgi:hypothetical protein
MIYRMKFIILFNKKFVQSSNIRFKEQTLNYNVYTEYIFINYT